MKLLCTESHNNAFVAGKEYDLTLLYGKYWTDETKTHVADLFKFQSHIERFLKLCGKSRKFLMETPSTGLMVELLVTEKYYIVYSHRKGSHYNIGGRHYYYFHDIETGEYIPQGLTDKYTTLIREKIRKPVADKFIKILKDRYIQAKVQPVLF